MPLQRMHRLLEGLGLRKNPILCFAAFLINIASMALSITLVYMLTDRFKFSPGSVGTVTASGGLAYLISCNIFQRFLSRIKVHTILPLGIAACLSASIMIGFAFHPVLVIIGWLLFQASMTLFWIPVVVWFSAGMDNIALNKGLGWWGISWMTGSLVGPLVGSGLYGLNSYLPFIFASGSLALMLLLLIYLRIYYPVQEDPRAAETEAPPPEGPPGEDQETGLPRVHKNIGFYKHQAWIGMFCSCAFSGIIINVVPLFIRDYLHHPPQTGGAILTVRGISALAAFPFMGKFHRWHFDIRWNILLHGLIILCGISYSFAGNSLGPYFITTILFGLLFAAFSTTSTFYCNADKINAGRNQAIHEMCVASGSITGSFIGGYGLQYIGMGNTFLALTLLQGAALTLVLFNTARRSRQGAGRNPVVR